MLSTLSSNLDAVRQRIDRAAEHGPFRGRARLLAVTKRVAPAVAVGLAELGVRDLGENRLEGLQALSEEVALRERGVQLHFIGNLQRNKARRVVQLADAIHSVDRLSLLRTLGSVAAEEQRRPAIYLQLQLWPEDSKRGFAPDQLDQAIEVAAGCPALELAGLMTMAPLIDDPAASRAAAHEVFTQLAELAAARADAPWSGGRALLSMGMSGDLEQAVAAGSDWLRIGTALFEGLPAELVREPVR